MQEIIPDIDRWRAEKKPVALATVVNTWGSSLRPVGAKMAVAAFNKISGSVSAGCVEGVVVQECIDTLESGKPRLLSYGVSNDTALSVGLTCGGEIQVFVRPMPEAHYPALRQAVLDGKTAALVTIIAGAEESIGREVLYLEGEMPRGDLGLAPDDGAAEAIAQAFGKGKSRQIELASHPGTVLFIDVMAPPPALYLIGGAHIAIALTHFAISIPYHVVVIDPRRAFANPERFPEADQILNLYPDEAFRKVPLNQNSAVAALAHDPKIDDPALIAALQSPCFYIGALGSKHSQALRKQRMLEAGITDENFARVHGPIGLHIGSRTPEEIAISILAEIIQARNQ